MTGILSLRKIRLFCVVAALASSTFPRFVSAARERSSGVLGEVISLSANDVLSGNNNQKKIFRTVQTAMATSAALTQAGISYHGGPVMEGAVGVYFIYYGSWSTNTSGQTILQTLLANIGNTPYYKIQQTYTNAVGTPLSATVNFKGSVTSTYAYSNGITLSDADIINIVMAAFNAGQVPVDSNSLYFVLTSPDVRQGTSGFCNSYCGWHNFFTTNTGVKIKYSFVGNPANCMNTCATQNRNISPNGNPGIDAMVSVILHELVEAQSDPQLNAWYDSQGYENADKCAWKFGTMYTASNGAYYNMVVGGKQYLIQQNWLNVVGSGSCTLSGPVSPTVAPVPVPVVKPVAKPVSAPVATPLAKPVPVPSPLSKPSASSGSGTTVTFQLKLKTDSWGYETGWVLSQNAPTAAVVLQAATGSLASNTLYTATANLGAGTYTFVITDQYGDGLQSGIGWYNVTVGGVVVKSGGTFTSSDSTPIFVVGVC